MDAERALVSKIAHMGTGIDELNGLGDEHFAHEDCFEVVQLIRAHVKKYGKPPTAPTIIEACPHFNFEMSEEPLEFLLDRFWTNIERYRVSLIAKELALAANDSKRGGYADLIEERLRELRTQLPAARDGGESALTGWESVYIHEAEAPRPPDIIELIYAGAVHLVSGEPSSMKTWLALVAAVEVVRAGGAAMYVSFPGESGKGEIVERLRQLGLTEREIIRFLFLEPKLPLTTPGALEQVKTLIEGWAPILRLVVLDSVGSALELAGMDSNSERDVQRFAREVVGPFRSSGAAVVLIDHVPKAAEGRGKFAIGSQRKVGMVDAHLSLETRREFGRGRTGIATIRTRRDRIGQLAHEAELRLASDAETGTVTYRLKVAQPGEESSFRPTHLMQRVSRYVQRENDGGRRPSQARIEENVEGKREFVRLSLDLLVSEGFLERQKGPRGAFLHKSIRPYREDEDDEPEGEGWEVFIKDKPGAGGSDDD